ncbi:MAG: site-2 protease family protein [Candidatus Kerfeldbacteria bacterium]|nr:site-2 protease family protein [Candidatus Kerfeldbacteria bacterium]
MLISTLFSDPILFIAVVIAIVYAISVHEFSHALGAYIQGDKTAQYEGRLTLNPFAHLDPIGFLLVLVAGFGWGKPTPFNPYNLRNQRFGPAIVGVFGPLSNFVSGVLFGLILWGVSESGMAADTLLPEFLSVIVFVNFLLGIFNLIPIPPLDGAKIFFPFFPRSFDNLKMTLERFGPQILMGIIFLDILLPGSFFAFVRDMALNLTSIFLPGSRTTIGG